MSIRRNKKAKSDPKLPTSAEQSSTEEHTASPGRLLALLWGIPIVIIAAAVVLKVVQA